MGWLFGSICKGKNLRGKDTLKLAQRICVNQEWERAVYGERSRLIFKLPCDRETILTKIIPHVALVHKVLQEKLVVDTNLQHSTTQPIFATDPSSPNWLLNNKKVYDTRDATFADDFERVTSTYRETTGKGLL